MSALSASMWSSIMRSRNGVVVSRSGRPAPRPARGSWSAAGPGPARRAPGVALPGDQRVEHAPPGHPEDIGGDHRQLDPGVLEQLLQPLLLARCVRRSDRLAVAGQVAQPPDRRAVARSWAGAGRLGDLGQPQGVDHVGLGPARHVLDVAGVDQPQSRTRAPPAGSTADSSSPRWTPSRPGSRPARQPVGQPQQRAGHRRIGRDLLQPPTRPALVRAPAHSTPARPCRCPAPRPSR